MRKGRGEVIRIGDLFESYRKRLRAPQRSVILVFVEVVDEVVGIEVSPDHVAYHPHSRTITLKTKRVIANEILLQKEEVLAHVAGRLGEHSAPKYLR